jgi:hypothetical protein
MDYPSLLDLPRPRLRAYRPETLISEKLHAMTVLGIENSRMKDFFDCYLLSEKETFDGARLADAIRTTFERRKTPVPKNRPLAVTEEFALNEEKQKQWKAFLSKNRLDSAPVQFGEIILRLSEFFTGPLSAAADGKKFLLFWKPRGPWK